MAQWKMGSRADLPTLKFFYVFALICCSFFEVKGNFKCDDNFLNMRCKNLFSSDYVSDCRGETLQVFPKCLFMASECKRRGQITKTVYTHSANVKYSKTYDKLIKKVKSYRRCFARNSRTCNESKIRDCYETFVHNSTKSCKDVHKLRFCILILRPKGCHEMRNPWYTLAVGIMKNYRSCFIRNYTILLEALQQRLAPTVDVTDVIRNKTSPGIVACKRPNYTFLGVVVIFALLAFGVLALLVCVKRGGLPLKSRRSLRLPQSNGHLEPLRSRICVTNGSTPLTFVVNEDEAPPPYYDVTGGVYAAEMDSPPPYTSRPTSVNGDFV